MDTLVSKYANSASTASFDDADNLGQNMAGWDAASQFALPAFDIPMVANVSSSGLSPFYINAISFWSNSFLMPLCSLNSL